ncbi:MAG: alpha/beta hydrolase, partial [Actinomycetota bacterium]|nr:alpha/beta hydrolase [Actinomycetota bacterium]
MTLEDRVIQYAPSGDAHLAYMVVGDGPVDLVWSSPGISNVEFWDLPVLREMLERMSSFSRLITFDQRGAGLSDPVPLHALPTMEERMDDFRAVLDAAGSERAAIVGQGHGGPTCILFASTYPDRVSSLVLYDTYARWMRDDDYPPGMPADATAR